MKIRELFKNKFIKTSSIVLLVSVFLYGLSLAYIHISETRINTHQEKLEGIDFHSSQSEFGDSIKAYLEKMPSKPFARFSNDQKRRIIINSLADIESHLNGEIMWNSKERSFGNFQRLILNVIKYPYPSVPVEYKKFIDDYSKTKDIFRGFELLSKLISDQISQTTLDDELIEMSKNTLSRLKKLDVFYCDDFIEEQLRISNEVE